jgi:DNA polymerase-3 subunit delta'
VSHSAEKSFELIKSAHERQRLAHAFLITGALGSGKEQLASRLITLVNGSSDNGGVDLFGEPTEEKILPLDEQENGWIRILRPRSKSRQISIDDIRDLEHTLQLAAPSGQTKVGVIVDADRMNEKAENAFLKTLEEPPDRTLLMLLTTKSQRLLPTILSRCVQVNLLGALNQVAKKGFGNPIAALHLKAVFSEFLAAKKSEVEVAAKAAAKEESAAYKDATDGTWLKAREDFHDAAAQADYLEARGRYLDVILAWLGDIIRIKNNAGGLDFPESASLLKTIADSESVLKITQRLESLESLRQTLETNASEPLALEVGFLKTFG